MSSARPSVRAILIDISGTLHIGDSLTYDAARALSRLRAARVPFRFCSNNSRESTAALHRRLTFIGLTGVRADEIWTSVGAVRDVVTARGLKRPYVIASDSARAEIGHGDDSVPYDGVVIALAPDYLSYSTLNEAFRVLVGEHPSQRDAPTLTPRRAPLIATHRSRVMQDADGRLSLGPGPFVAALEHASGVAAEVVGKPTRAFFEAVVNSLHFDDVQTRGTIAVIGDDIESDLGSGARELGFWRVLRCTLFDRCSPSHGTILVQTGKYRPGVETQEGVHPPDEIAPSFASFIDDLLGSE